MVVVLELIAGTILFVFLMKALGAKDLWEEIKRKLGF
jgi:hypothetical protein